MDEGKKKMIMIVIIVACFVAAGAIFFATQRTGEGGVSEIKPGKMLWIKCRDPKCEHTWQMDNKEYYEYIDKNRIGMTVPPIVCPQCGGETGYRAEKCGKCGYIFERVTTGDLADRCPKCGYSAMEELRKSAGGGVKPEVETPEATETPAEP